MVPMIGRALKAQWWLPERRLFLPLLECVRFVRSRSTRVPVYPHRPVSVIAVDCAPRSIDGDLVKIHAQAIALRIAVRKEPSLQHLVRREPDTWHHIRWVECCLLNIREIVFRVLVEFYNADFDQRIVLMWPHLGEVKGVDVIRSGLAFRHDLNGQCPARKVPSFNAFIQVTM